MSDMDMFTLTCADGPLKGECFSILEEPGDGATIYRRYEVIADTLPPPVSAAFEVYDGPDIETKIAKYRVKGSFLYYERTSGNRN